MPTDSDPFENCRWIPADESEFGIEVFDCAPFCQSMMSTTSNPDIAALFSGLRASTGEEYRGRLPSRPLAIDCQLSYPFSGGAKDGPLFKAQEMEDKWDIYLYDSCLYFVRSWTGQLNYQATIRFDDGEARVSTVTVDSEGNPEPRITIGTVDFLIKTYIYGQQVPHPLPPHLPRDAQSVTLFSFSQFGRGARFGTYKETTQLVASK